MSAAVGDLSVGVDPDELATLLAVRDRLDARVADAVARFDAAELWSDDGSTSMSTWLVVEARLDPDGTLVVADPRDRTWRTRPPGPANGPPHQPLTFGA